MTSHSSKLGLSVTFLCAVVSACSGDGIGNSSGPSSEGDGDGDSIGDGDGDGDSIGDGDGTGATSSGGRNGGDGDTGGTMMGGAPAGGTGGGNESGGSNGTGGLSAGCDALTCGDNASCIPENPPLCECDPGYEGDGKDCTDVDGCVGVTCFKGGTCTDHPPPSAGYACPACPPGTLGDGETCKEGIILVDASASGTPDGLTWPTAYTDLQSAIDAAQAGDQIWIAKGVYRAPKDNAPVAVLTDGIDIYGGFAGTEVVFEQRAGLTEQTILSGDVKDDDTGPTTGKSDNSGPVVAADNVSNALLDGLTIEDGYASGISGGGMRLTQSSLVLNNLIFRNNGTAAGYNGGALFNNASSPVLTNCRFLGNFAVDVGGGQGRGGAIYNAPGSNPQVTNASFVRNRSYQGGAVFSDQAPGVYSNVVFAENSVDWYGGAVAEISTPPFSLTSTFSDSIFLSNSAVYRGSATYHFSSTPEFDNVTFAHNAQLGTVATGGGALSITNYTARLRNTSFIGNTSDIGAAAIRTNTNEGIEIINGTFVGNVSGGTSAALEITVTETATVENSVFWNNQNASGPEADVLNSGTGTLTVNHSCIDDSTQVSSGTGNVTLAGADNPHSLVTASGETYLAAGSACLDRGNAASAEAAGFSTWATLTTRESGALDVTPLDAGRHQLPSGARIFNFTATPSLATWSADGAAGCEIFDPAQNTLTPVDPTGNHTPSALWTAATRLVLICRGAGGIPSAALAVVP